MKIRETSLFWFRALWERGLGFRSWGVGSVWDRSLGFRVYRLRERWVLRLGLPDLGNCGKDPTIRGR